MVFWLLLFYKQWLVLYVFLCHYWPSLMPIFCEQEIKWLKNCYKVINGKKNSKIERLFTEKEILFVALLTFTLLRFGQFAVLKMYTVNIAWSRQADVPVCHRKIEFLYVSLTHQIMGVVFLLQMQTSWGCSELDVVLPKIKHTPHLPHRIPITWNEMQES